MAFIRGIIDRIVLVAGIVAAGCIPSFIAQYRQRAGGRLDQVLKDIEPFQQIANQYHHGSLKELIQHHLGSSDATFHDEGAALQAMVSSAEQLRRALQALDTDLFHQLGYLLTGGADPQIAQATWEAYSPAFNLTIESIMFGSIIGVLIWLVFLSIWYIIAKLVNILTAR
ncbi:MAG: DUF2937 family protein [Gallionella sp.]|nr:DUF2937 family protein [Gallionella sp.]